MKVQIPLLLLFAFLLPFAEAQAQNSAKSKSKDRFREKDNLDNSTKIFNEIAANGEDMEMAPAFYKNGVVFVSNRNSEGGRDRKTGEAYTSLWFSPRDPNGKLTPARRLPMEVTATNGEGPATFSRDFKTLFYSHKNNENGVPKAGRDGRVHMKTYIASDNGREWESKGEMPFCSNEYDCAYPSLSADGQLLYFSSNMPGGYGGFDIYYTDMSDAGWTKPVNAGPVINSAADELFPFIAQSGTLFFSSNGHNTLGGYDLFFANPTPEGFQEVYNLNAPYNTPANETSIIVDFDGKTGFFTSDRESGMGGLDIFSFISANGIQGIEKPKVISAEMMVVDAKTGEPLQGASVYIRQPSGDGPTENSSEFPPNASRANMEHKNVEYFGNPDLITNAIGKAIGDFTQYKQYLVIISREGYDSDNRLFVADQLEGAKLKFELNPQPPCIRAGGIIVQTEQSVRLTTATIKFVHTASGHITTVSANANGEFDTCLPDVGGYTVFLESNGFVSNNFGFVASLQSPFFRECYMTPLSSAVENNVRQAIKLPPAQKTLLPEPEKPTPFSDNLGAGSVFIIEGILSERSKTGFKPNSIPQIDSLFSLMQRYPLMKIKITAHRDTRGVARTNLKASKEYAKNIKTYLVHRGITSNRIRAVGKGEKTPRNHCLEGVECNDQQHQENNRLEIKIVKMGQRP